MRDLALAASLLLRAKSRLVLDQPWLAHLVLRLEFKERAEGLPTAATDGRSIYYNPDWVGGLDVNEAVAVLGHEALHCGLGHLWRRGQRNAGKFNRAADYAVNDVLAESGYKLPAGALCDKKYSGLSAEAIYDILPDSPLDHVTDLMPGQGSPGQERALEREWKGAMIEAAHDAVRRGNQSAMMERLLEDALKVKVDWREELAAAITRAIGQDDYTYRRPSRRGLALGVVLPSLYGEVLGDVVLCMDTSGSMSAKDIGQAVAEIRSVCSIRHSVITVIEADCSVLREISVGPDEDYSPVKTKGGGGTDFRPALHRARSLEPAVTIYISDLDGEFPESYPGDLIWVTTSSDKAPLGRTLQIT